MAKVFMASSGKTRTIEIPLPEEGLGKSIVFEQGGEKLAGVCKCMTANGPVVELAIPDEQGVLRLTGNEIILTKNVEWGYADDLKISEEPLRVKTWEASLALTLGDGETKSITAVRANPEDDKSAIVDYLDVEFEGYLSTFVGSTPADRDGDYVMPKAFDKTLAKFRENPVMLLDHENRTGSLAGSFIRIGTNEKGLAVRGKLSNAPGLRDIRFKVAEGHLKTLSMGGLFLYNNDGRGIEEVTLFEGSLCAVPANPDCTFSVRNITAIDAAKMYKKYFRFSS